MESGSQGAPLPGWYRDPWNAGQRRFWDGQAWTGHVYSGVGPVPEDRLWPASSHATVAGQERRDDANPLEPPYVAIPAPPTTPPPSPYLPPSPTAPKSGLQRWVPVLLVLALVVGVAGGFGAVYAATGGFHHGKKAAATAPSVTQPPSSVPPLLTPGLGQGVQPSPSSDPAAPHLSDLVVRQADVTQPNLVQPIPGGNLVSGAPTLDVCNGTFPSEANRTARLQVALTDDQGHLLLSTEAVAYDKPALTSQAFDELRSVAAKCPATPVTSPVSEPTVTTKVNAAPDGGWPQVASVDRLAFDLTTTDEQGQSDRTLAIYLRRGRVLIGVYFATPDAQPAVNGQTTVAGIVNVFAQRLAQLPADVVNG